MIICQIVNLKLLKLV